MLWAEQNNLLRTLIASETVRNSGNPELLAVTKELLQKPAEAPDFVAGLSFDDAVDLCRADGTARSVQNTPTLQNLLPFTVAAERAQATCRAWMGSEFTHPRDLRATATIAAPIGVYLPAWLWSAHARSTWTAMAVHFERRTRTIRIAGLAATKPTPETTEVEVIRHAPVLVSGDHEGAYPNIWVLAFAGPTWLNEVWPTPKGYDFGKLVVYDPALVAPYRIEEPTYDREVARQIACKQIGDLEATACRALMPGDEVEAPVVKTKVDSLVDTLIYLPVWRVSYQYGVKSYQCHVNGQSGAAVCEGPVDKARSWLPFIVVLVVLVLILAFVFLGGSRLLPR